jgi:hypothetical protein
MKTCSVVGEGGSDELCRKKEKAGEFKVKNRRTHNTMSILFFFTIMARKRLNSTCTKNNGRFKRQNQPFFRGVLNGVVGFFIQITQINPLQEDDI